MKLKISEILIAVILILNLAGISQAGEKKTVSWITEEEAALPAMKTSEIKSNDLPESTDQPFQVKKQGIAGPIIKIEKPDPDQLYDDLIDTAGSVVNAAEALRLAGAQNKIYVAATHAVFSDPATERLSQAGLKEIVVTDTIPFNKTEALKNLQVLSVAGMISKNV